MNEAEERCKYCGEPIGHLEIYEKCPCLIDKTKEEIEEMDKKLFELNDLSPMPFGQHKGKPMQDVPASYLHWLWTKQDFNRESSVGKYIKKSLSALKEEYSNGIWK